jgi:hypothetical protein
MNGKQLACVILMILIGFMTYGLQIFNNKARERQMEAEDAVAEAEAAATDADLMHTILEKAQFEAAELRKFLREWTVLIDRLGSRQEVETAILSINRDSNIFVLSQRFEDKANTNQKMMPKQVMVSMLVEDEFPKVMNWFGTLEQRVPLMRVKTCRVTSGSTGRQIQMEVTLEVPLIDLAAAPELAVAKKP